MTTLVDQYKVHIRVLIKLIFFIKACIIRQYNFKGKILDIKLDLELEMVINMD